MGFVLVGAIGIGTLVGIIVISATLADALRKTLPRLLEARADRLSGRGASEPQLAQLHETLDQVQRRLSEVEERLDFTERTLAKQRDATRLPPPQY